MRQTDSVVQVQPPEEAQSPKTSLNFSHSLAHENLELKSKLTAEQLVHLNCFLLFCVHIMLFMILVKFLMKLLLIHVFFLCLSEKNYIKKYVFQSVNEKLSSKLCFLFTATQGEAGDRPCGRFYSSSVKFI